MATKTNPLQTPEKDIPNEVAGIKHVQPEKKYHSTTDEHEAESKLIQFDIARLVSIKLDVAKYLTLKFRKHSFVLYPIEVSLNTKRKTTWNVYLKYSEMDAFHQKLIQCYKQTCKFNPTVKSKLFCPKMPPKKPWQRNKFDPAFIEQRIHLFNIYMIKLSKYVSYSTRKTQDLYMRLFQIDSLYKYVVNEDIQMLSALQKYDPHTLATRDANNSNILHYIASAQSTQCIECIQCNKALITALLHSKDHFNWTPLQLAKHLKNEQILNTLKAFDDTQSTEEKESETKRYLPVQYVQNVCSATYKRRIWIILNPASGQGFAQMTWQEAVKPFLDFHAQSIEYDLLITTKQYHAQEVFLTLAADHTYDAVVVLGGDGTISEIMNGLYYNKQIQDHRMCVVPIAVGSGNALATELDVKDVVDALRKLHSGFVSCMSAYLACQVDEPDTYSFVSSQWGSVSSIDLESEYMRFLGSIRFTLKALGEIAYSASYKARIYFKPLDCNVMKQFTDARNTKREVNNDPHWWKELEPIDFDALVIEGNRIGKYPSDWVCVEGEFEILCVTNLQWIGEKDMMGGQGGFDCKSNALRLVYNERMGRVNQTNALLGIETGKHLDLEYVKHYDVCEVVIEPLGNGPPMDVDGERKPLKPLHIKLLPSDFLIPF
eukprot:638189_1